jgi:uncharacterized coiled-coil protein SlyX
MNPTNKLVVPEEILLNKILLIRNQKVMLDKDLAELYGVTTSNLNKAVKRNIDRFPDDFMFQLTKEEFENLIFQIGISNPERPARGGTRKLPFAFTEQGVAMLSGVLTSERAVKVNIQIMRIYSKMRALMNTHKDLIFKVNELENKVGKQDKSIQQLFEYLRQLIHQENEPRKRIGFKE